MFLLMPAQVTQMSSALEKSDEKEAKPAARESMSATLTLGVGQSRALRGWDLGGLASAKGMEGCGIYSPRHGRPSKHETSSISH